MKLTALAFAGVFALAAGAATADCGPNPNPKAKAAEHQAPCAQTAAKQGPVHRASGVVKKSDAAKSAVTLAHDPVKELDWPAMTMAFKVRDKAVLDKLAVGKKVEFTFVRDGRDYVITAAR